MSGNGRAKSMLNRKMSMVAIGMRMQANGMSMSKEGSIESMSIEEIVVPGDETADTVRLSEKYSVGELNPDKHLERVVNETIDKLNIEPLVATYKGIETTHLHTELPDDQSVHHSQVQ
jgi:hypothetical protein